MNETTIHVPAYDLPHAETIKEWGAQAGRNAATWYFDGNTDDETYAAVLKGIRDGDPEVLDGYATPVLDGPGEVREQLEIDPRLEIDMGHVEIVTAAEEWAGAAHDAFWDAVEAEAAKHVAEALADALDEATDAARAAGLLDAEILGALIDHGAKWDEDSELAQARGWTGVTEQARS